MNLSHMTPVELDAQMIVQEGRDAALEIAETAGVEAALDAMALIADNRQAEMLRYREALDTIATGHAFGPQEVARAALRGPLPSSDLTKEA